MEPTQSRLNFGQFKTCMSCKHHPRDAHSIDDAPGQCWVCSSRSTRQNPLPLWERKETTMGSIMSAIRDEEEERARRVSLPSPEAKPLDTQVAGDHYKSFKIQPIEFAMENSLNACQTIAIRYIVRKKGDKAKKLEDLDKAIHTLEIYKQMIKEGRIDV